MLNRDRVKRTTRTLFRYLDANLVMYALNISISKKFIYDTYKEAMNCHEYAE